METAEARVAAVREAVGPDVEIFIEVHGRLSGEAAIAMGRRLEKYRPGFYEEPVSPYDLDLLKEVKAALPFPIAAGERLYMLEEFARLTSLRAVDVAQPDLVPLRRAVDGQEDRRLGAGATEFCWRRTCRSGPWRSVRQCISAGRRRTCSCRRISRSTTFPGEANWCAAGI